MVFSINEPEQELHASKGILYDDHNRILMLKDSTTRYRRTIEFWDLPGGKKEGDELPYDTLMREIPEETTIHVIPAQYLGSYAIRLRKGIVHCGVYRCVPLSFNVDITKNPATDEHILDYRWTTIEDAIRELPMSRDLKKFLTEVRR